MNEKFIKKEELDKMDISDSDIEILLKEKIIKNNSDGNYIVNAYDDLNLFLLKKLINSERTIFTKQDLDYLEISYIDKKRLYAYNIVQDIDGFRFRVIDDINKIRNHKDEIDVNLYREIYKELYSQKKYIKARKALLKYIPLVEKFDIKDSCYYDLDRLNNIINVMLINKSTKDAYKLSNDIFNCTKSGKYRESVEIANRFYEEFGDIPQSYFLLGVVNNYIHNNREAIKYLQKSRDLEPLNPFVHKQLGYAYKAVNRLDDSYKSYRKYIKLDKDLHVDGYTNLFGVLLKEDKIDKAIQLFFDVQLKFDEKAFSYFSNNCRNIAKARIADLKENITDNLLSLEYKARLQQMIYKIDCIVDKDTSLSETQYEEMLKRQKENEKKGKELEKLIQPNEDNVVSLKKMDNYISNLQLPQDEKNIVILQAALVLQKSNYTEKSIEYIKRVERAPKKSQRVREEMEQTKKELILLRKGKY